MPDKRRVVIIGGGFGGAAAAKKLKRADVEVTLVDRTNHQLFQPLLYQVATGGLSAGQCASSIRGMFKRQKNATVLMAEAKSVDVEHKAVALDNGELLPYDSLIVACGARTSYFGHDEWSEVSSGLKTLQDAVDLRERVFGSLEEAERIREPAARDEWLTFAVVGGGPTGVEVSGQLAVILHHQLKHDFRRIDPRDVKVILLDAGERVLAAFSEKLSAYAGKSLGKIGVDVREGARVTAIDARGVDFEIDGSGQRINSRTVIWAAGVQAVGLTKAIADAAGGSTDRGGRIEVGPDLTIPGHPEISVIGDAAHLEIDGRPLPGLATVAIQEARHVAKAIKRGQAGATEPFKYFDKGALAVVGRGRAICAVRGVELHGPLAFLMYLGVHLYYLGGLGGRRIEVIVSWATTGLGALQNRAITNELPSIERPAATPETRPAGVSSPV